MDVVGNYAGGFDEVTGKIKVGLRRRWKGDFYFFVSELDQEFEEAEFLFAVLSTNHCCQLSYYQVSKLRNSAVRTIGSTRD